MLDLLIVLTPISLIDSASVIPFAVVVLAVLFGGKRPYLGASAFLSGIVISYLAAGILIVVGLGELIDQFSERLVHWFNNPDAIDYAIGIVVGTALVLFGYRIATARQEKGKQRKVSAGMTPAQAFLLGAGSTIAGLWGALPYFAAIDQIFKANVSDLDGTLALAYYNLIFVVPLATLVVIRAIVGERAAGLFDAVNRFFAVWGKRVLIVVLVVLGAVMVVDGIGGLMGYPLIPVG